MADERFPSPRAGDAPQEGASSGGPGRGSRPAGGREGGGFRIRLSDNEMQAARALQEAFGLRSTVAVLGFSLRTLAQQLESGQLDDLIAQQRAHGGSRPGGGREGGRSGEGGRPGDGGRSGERRRERGPQEQGRGGRGRVDPFARPARPAAAPAEEESVALEPEDELTLPAAAEAEATSHEVETQGAEIQGAETQGAETTETAEGSEAVEASPSDA